MSTCVPPGVDRAHQQPQRPCRCPPGPATSALPSRSHRAWFWFLLEPEPLTPQTARHVKATARSRQADTKGGRAREAGADNVADTVRGGHPTDMRREAPPTGRVGFPPAEPRHRACGSRRTPAPAPAPPPLLTALSTPPAEGRLRFLSWQPPEPPPFCPPGNVVFKSQGNKAT